MKKIIAILLSVILANILICSVSASDIEPLDTPQLYWNSIASITNDLDIKNNVAEISVAVRATTSVDYISVTSVLQKKSFVFFWTDKYTYNYSFSTYYGIFEKDVPHIDSGTWRLKTTVTTYKKGVVQEEVTVYSER